MNILITGVEGFVGRYLVDLIPKFMKDVNQIYGTYFSETNSLKELKNIKLTHMDLTNEKEVKAVMSTIKPDYVFHLAAQSSVGLSWKHPNLTMDININGTINLLDSIREINNECKILIIGSSEQYGKIEACPVNEEHRLDPQNPYSVSKVCQEQLAKLYVKAYNMKIIITRSFNHIGPYQDPQFVVPDWAKQIAEIEKGLKQPVISVGDISVKRDFTDVRDVVEAYIHLIQMGIPGEIYNIGTGKAYELNEILRILLSLSEKNIKVEVDKNKIRPIENPIIECDKTKIFNLCGWYPRYKVEDTLKDILDNWREIL